MRASSPKPSKPPLPPVAGFGSKPVRELDRVRILRAVLGDDDVSVPAGATGTVVAIYADGEAFEVEFTEPVDALATVEAAMVCRVELSVG